MSRQVYPHVTPYLFVINLMSKMRSCGAAMLDSRCLIHTYVIHRSLYACLQLRKLALSSLDSSQCKSTSFQF